MLLPITGRRDRSQQIRNLSLAFSLPVCLCLGTLVNAAFHPRASLPQFRVLQRAAAPEAWGLQPEIKTYRVLHIIPCHEYSIVVTDDGSRFAAVGNMLDQMKPGFVFRAQTQLVPMRPTVHPERRLVWLIEPPT